MSAHRPIGLFASLRRDRMLFAVVGTLVMLLAALQPLAAAQTGGGGHMALCTAFGVSGGSGAASPDTGPDCPLCGIGHLCGSAALHKATPVVAAAFPAPAALVGGPALPAPGKKRATLLDAPPPAIRAPPFPA